MEIEKTETPLGLIREKEFALMLGRAMGKMGPISKPTMIAWNKKKPGFPKRHDLLIPISYNRTEVLRYLSEQFPGFVP